ncbi:uncharacterized protein J7T54_002459 [Emericellopsis cladophorae]|uniref:Uncharacterized protein n=1 Tax=Emericellopsis cladophorae TaxID=2686198 RepID=A0A9Q0BDT3_9HYPO|nr:uncharacterized protein J7T54_002459 [Emericellopsis cladophorae]KAI6782222.1 hypothetical protein J7T54_002459 [Emericellopsis cladophorae]
MGTFAESLADLMKPLRDNQDEGIRKTDDLVITIAQLRSENWIIDNSLRITIDNHTTLKLQKVDAILRRLPNAIEDELTGHGTQCHVTVSKRGHLLMDREIAAGEVESSLGMNFSDNLHLKYRVLQARLENRIRREFSMVLLDTVGIGEPRPFDSFIVQAQTQPAMLPLTPNARSILEAMDAQMEAWMRMNGGPSEDADIDVYGHLEEEFSYLSSVIDERTNSTHAANTHEVNDNQEVEDNQGPDGDSTTTFFLTINTTGTVVHHQTSDTSTASTVNLAWNGGDHQNTVPPCGMEKPLIVRYCTDLEIVQPTPTRSAEAVLNHRDPEPANSARRGATQPVSPANSLNDESFFPDSATEGQRHQTSSAGASSFNSPAWVAVVNYVLGRDSAEQGSEPRPLPELPVPARTFAFVARNILDLMPPRQPQPAVAQEPGTRLSWAQRIGLRPAPTPRGLLPAPQITRGG